MIASFRQRVLEELARTVDNDDSQWQRWRHLVERALDAATQERTESSPVEGSITDPVLQGGALVPQPVIAYRDPFRVPPGCHLQHSLFAAHRVEIGRNSRVDGVVVAESALIAGGPQSSFDHLMAGELQFESAPASVSGNIWCDLPLWRGASFHLPPHLDVRGVVSVQSAHDAPIVVQSHSRLGALIARSAVQTESHCRIGHLYSGGPLMIGRDNAIGRVEGARVVVPHDSQLTAVISGGDVAIEGTSRCDTIRAAGDISLGPEVVITGPVIISSEGRFRFPVGKAWHLRRDHWFYETETGYLLPVKSGQQRPASGRLLAIQALNHALWEQMSWLQGDAA